MISYELLVPLFVLRLNLLWHNSGASIVKGYLRYKTIFYSKVALDV